MRKNHLYLFLSVLSCTLINTSSYAQVSGVKITESKELVLNNEYFQDYGTPNYLGDNVGYVSDHYIASQKKFFIAGLDLKGNASLGEKEIGDASFPDTKAGQVFQFNNKLYLVSFEKVKNSKIESIYFQEVDLNSQKLIGDKKLMASTDQQIDGFLTATRVKMGYEATSVGTTMSGYIDYSTDKSKFVLYYRMGEARFKEDKEKAKMSFTVFDKDLQKVWSKEIEIPYQINDKIRYTVDSKNNLFIFVKEYKDGRDNGKDGSVNVKYSLLKLSPTANSFEKIPVPSFGKYLSRVNFYEASTGELYVGGFFLKSIKDWEPGGLLMYQIQNNSVAVRANVKFGIAKEEIADKMEALRKVSGAVYAAPLYEYHMKDIRVIDGGKYLVTGYGSIWGGATRFCDFQLGYRPFNPMPSSTSNASTYQGFNEQDPIVLLVDSSKVIWNYNFSNTFFVSNVLESSSSGFLIDKSNSVYLFTRSFPPGVKMGMTGWKKRPVEDIKLNKVGIDGKLETQLISNGVNYLSSGYSDVHGIINSKSQLVYVVGGIKGDAERNSFIQVVGSNSGKPTVLKFITVTAD